MKFRTLVQLAALIAALLVPSSRLEAQPFFPLEPDDGIGFDQVGFDFGGGFFYPFSAWAIFTLIRVFFASGRRWRAAISTSRPTAAG